MAKYRPIKTAFWTDPYIQTLSVTEKLVFCYLLTNPMTKICGMYEISVRTISFETGLKINDIEQSLHRLSTDCKIVRYNNWIHIVNFKKHQQNNPSVLQAIEREILEIPEDIRLKLQTVPSVSQAIHKPIPNLTKPKLNLTKLPTTNVVQPVAESVVYGNKEINDLLLAIKSKIGIEDFVDSKQWSRIYGSHLVNLKKKLTKEKGLSEFGRRLDLLINDDFKRKNCNSIKFIYNQLKGWIEPSIQATKKIITKPHEIEGRLYEYSDVLQWRKEGKIKVGTDGKEHFNRVIS